jgi:hypothetical protein
VTEQARFVSAKEGLADAEAAAFTAMQMSYSE